MITRRGRRVELSISKDRRKTEEKPFKIITSSRRRVILLISKDGEERGGSPLTKMIRGWRLLQ